MKKILFIVLIFAFTGSSSYGQLVLQRDTVLKKISEEWAYIGHLNYLQQGTTIPLKRDSVIYTYANYPGARDRFQPAILGDYWNSTKDTMKTYTNAVKIVQTKGGRIIGYQFVYTSMYVIIDRTTKDDLMWYYTRQSRRKGITAEAFREDERIKNLLHVNINDSIQ